MALEVMSSTLFWDSFTHALSFAEHLRGGRSCLLKLLCQTQGNNILDVPGMREEVKGLHFSDFVATLDKFFEIARLCGRIARYID
jgi:hypothetical protein